MRDTPIEGPAVWRGDEMAKRRDEWVFPLSGADISALSTAAEQMLASGKPLNEVTKADVDLGAAEAAVLHWREVLETGHGFVLVRGVPVDDWSEEKVSAAYWAMGLWLGQAVSQNTDGDVLGHVRNTGADPKDPTVRLYKTNAAQGFHMDGADLVGLLCLKPAKTGGLNRLVSAYTIYNLLLAEDPALCAALHEPVAFDTQGQHAPGQQPWMMFPIAQTDPTTGALNLFYIGWYITDAQRHDGVPPLTPLQAKAIERLEAHAHDPAIHLDMDFRPGDIQLIKNAALLHARTAFEDYPEPERRRHLLRLWLASDYFSAGDDRLRGGIQQRDDTLDQKKDQAT